MLIHELVCRGAHFHPNRIALRHGPRQISYGDLHAQTDQIAARIRDHHLAGATGALFAENSIEYVLGYFSITKAGGVITPTTTSLPIGRLGGELDFCDAQYVVTTKKQADRVLDVARQVDKIHTVVVIGDGGRSVDFHGIRPVTGRGGHGPLVRRPEDPAVMFSTSGTASDPKRVVLSHNNLLANVSTFLRISHLNQRDRGMIVLPLTAIGTNTSEMLAYLATGMTVRLYSGVFVLGEFCRVLEDEQINVMNVTPFILNMMLWKSAEVANRARTVKKIFFASAPIAISQFERLLEAFPAIDFYYGYGQTEASPRCTTLIPAHQPEKLGSSGPALPGVEIRVVDDDDRPVGIGTHGEITVRGPNIMMGYYKRPDQTAETLRDGWLHTGDCGYMDEDGFVFIKGRKKNIIITRGITVSPEEVEQEILGNPGVHEVFVAGKSDDRVGEAIVAYVVPREGAELSEEFLKTFLRDRLDPVKIPSRIEFVTQLKRNYNHKLIRS